MDKKIIEFGKRMDSANDKERFIEFASGAKCVLDLGAGTGAMARTIAEKYGCHVDAIDLEWKAENVDSCGGKVSYFRSSIEDYVRRIRNADAGRYDCIILSAIIHELDVDTLIALKNYLPMIMADNCRIMIREPFFNDELGPVAYWDHKDFIKLVSENVSAAKMLYYKDQDKLSHTDYLDPNPNFDEHDANFWVNLAFVLSYGEDSWERESKEYRYAYSLDWCKKMFDFYKRSYTGFQVYSVLDTTYRQHFINAGIPGEAFDLIRYTGMHIIIDYSK